jgi:hypothetical protein
MVLEEVGEVRGLLREICGGATFAVSRASKGAENAGVDGKRSAARRGEMGVELGVDMRIGNVLTLLACLILGWAVQAQVWVDETQLKGKLPDWVDPQYCKPAEPMPVVHRIWVEPVYRTCARRVWHEPVYSCVAERIWVAGHYETHQEADCTCPTPRQVRVWVDGHYETRERRVLVTPGYWEEVAARELVAPGHWEMRGS